MKKEVKIGLAIIGALGAIVGAIFGIKKYKEGKK